MNTLDTEAGIPVRDRVTPLLGSGTGLPAPTWHRARVLASAPHGRGYHFLRLEAPSIARTCQAGQFVMLTAARDGDSGPVLPRPMAVYGRNPRAGTIDILLRWSVTAPVGWPLSDRESGCWSWDRWARDSGSPGERGASFWSDEASAPVR